MSQKLLPGELVKANNGYTGHPQIVTPGVAKTRKVRKQKSQIRGRHENVNGRFKVFGVMKNWHNTDIAKHGLFSWSVAIIVQLSFTLGEKLYDVPYKAKYN